MDGLSTWTPSRFRHASMTRTASFLTSCSLSWKAMPTQHPWKSGSKTQTLKLFHQVEEYLHSSIEVSINAPSVQSLHLVESTQHESTQLPSSEWYLHHSKHLLLENMMLALPNLQHFQTVFKPFCIFIHHLPAAFPMCCGRSETSPAHSCLHQLNKRLHQLLGSELWSSACYDVGPKHTLLIASS